MLPSDTFADLMVRLRFGDDDAAAEVHRRFVRRLVALACRQFDPWLRPGADHEDVVQSVFKSFFARCERGEFALEGWGGLWGLLAVITVRKCGRRRAALRAGRRDAAREIAWPADGGEAVDREPTPEEAAMLAETVQQWLGAMDPSERGIVESGLQGYSDPEIADHLRRSERTVRRIRRRAEDRLCHLIATEEGPP